VDLLLDSNIIILAAGGSLSEDVTALVESEHNRLFFSTAAYWEISIKYASGRLALPIEPWLLVDALVKNGYREVPIGRKHVYTLSSIADVHKDPFDRIMVAQAIAEDMLLLTTDALLHGYGQNVRVVRK